MSEPPSDDATKGEGRRDPVVEVRTAVQDARPHELPADDVALANEPRNDLGNARRLVARHGHNLAAIGQEKVAWLVWDGKRFSREAGFAEALRLAQQTSEKIIDEADAIAAQFNRPRPIGADNAPEVRQWASEQARNDKRASLQRRFALSSGNIGKCRAMLDAAVPVLRRAATEFDALPMLFNVENGTLEFRSASDIFLREHRQADLLTKLARVAYDPEADCPKFRAFVHHILPNRRVARYVQSLLGYCLTGDTGEQTLFIFLGPGANGKSTLIETICDILSDYAVTLDIKTFLHNDRQRGGDATPDLARLPGARLVTAAEPEPGDRLSESLIKTITGGERIVVRPLFKDQSEIQPSFKPIILANNAPTIRGSDDGIWRRIVMVPFDVRIAKEARNKHLKEDLLKERAGILNWLLDGLRIYLEEGLQPPPEVMKATDEYRTDNDQVGLFLSAATAADSAARVSSRELRDAYHSWCEANGLEPVHDNTFGRKMTDRGIRREKCGIMYYLGLRLIRSSFASADDAESNNDSPPDQI